MNAEQRPLWIAVIAVAVLALFANGPQSAQEELRLSARTAGPLGGMGLFAAAEALGLEPDVSSIDWALLELRDERVTLVSLARQSAPSRAEASGLVEFLQGGGAALVVLPEVALDDAEDASAATLGHALLDELGLTAAAAAGSAQRALSTESADAAGWLAGWLDGLGDEFGSPTWVFAAAEGESGPDLRPLLVDESGRPSLAHLELGSGELLLLGDAGGLANSALDDSALAAVCLRALRDWRATHGTVTFDEYGHSGGLGGSTGTLAWLLISSGPGRALLGLVAVAALALLVRGIRLGAPEPERPRPARSSLEHAAALARGYDKVGAVQRPAAALLREAERRLGVGDRAELALRIRAGAEQQPALRASAATLFEILGPELQPAAGGRRTSPAELVRAAEALDILAARLARGGPAAR